MKVFFGILMILAGAIISLATTFTSLPLIFSSFLALLKNGADAHSIGYFLGSVIAFLMLMALAIFLALKGSKWIKRSSIKSKESIEEY